MTITKDYLEASARNLAAQREAALKVVLRCEGAIEVVEQELLKLEEAEPATPPDGEPAAPPAAETPVPPTPEP